MNIHTLNRKKNILFRKWKRNLARFIFDRKNKHVFSSKELPHIKKVLFLRHDNKLGDMTVSTLAFRELKKRLPQAEISVIAGNSSLHLIKNNPHISKIFIYKKNLFDIFKLGRTLAQEHFDLYIDMDKEVTPGSILLLSLIKPRFAFGFNRGKYAMYNVTETIDFPKLHITDWYKKMFERLGLLAEGESFDSSYELFVPAEASLAARNFLDTLPKADRNIIFNPFAASRHRCFSFEQAQLTAEKFPQDNIILIGPKKELEAFGQGNTFPKNLFKAEGSLYDSFGIWASVALLERADLLISPDTYIVHVASALKKSVFSVFTIDQKQNWAPSKKNISLVLDEGQDFNNEDIRPLLEQI